MSKANTEEDTFRVLARRPMNEIYQEIIDGIGPETTMGTVVKILREYGYSFWEFSAYDAMFSKGAE